MVWTPEKEAEPNKDLAFWTRHALDSDIRYYLLTECAFRFDPEYKRLLALPNPTDTEISYIQSFILMDYRHLAATYKEVIAADGRILRVLCDVLEDEMDPEESYGSEDVAELAAARIIDLELTVADLQRENERLKAVIAHPTPEPELASPAPAQLQLLPDTTPTTS